MKKYARLTAALLAVCLMCSLLSACGGGNGESVATANPLATADGKVWSTSFSTPEGLKGTPNAVAISGEKIYAAYTGGSRNVNYSFSGVGGTSSVTSSTSTYDTEYVPEIYVFGADGSAAEKLEAYSPAPLPEKNEGSANIGSLCVDPEGNLWAYENAYLYHYELPEGFSGTDADKEQYYKDDGSRHLLRKLDPTGAELLTIDLTDISKDIEYFSVQGMECGADGSLYFSDGESSLYVYGADGTFSFKLDVSGWVNSVKRLSDGSVAVTLYEDQGFVVKPVDVKTKAWGKSVTVGYPDNTYSGGGDYLFMYTISGALYGYNAEKGESEKILTWLDCDVYFNDVRDVALTGDGAVLCVLANYSDDITELALVSKQDASSVQEKTVLTMAVMYTDYNLTKQVMKFNRASDKYRITVKDYSEFNTEDDYTAGLTKLNTEIIAGNVPDIISVQELPMRQYVAKGLLTDLYEYIDSDPDMNRSDFVQSAMKAMEINGGLYQASAEFGVYTVVGRSDVVGPDMGWTLDEMMDCLAAQPEGTELFQQGITQKEILQYLCFMNMSKYVDWDTGACNFDSDEFKKLLRFCKQFDESFEYSEDTYESEASRIKSGKQLLSLFVAYDFSEFQMYEAMYGGEISYKGFPTESGSGSILYTSAGLAISSACKDKEGAWSFVRTMLTEDYQTGGDVWAFPTNQKAFDQKLAEAMKVEYTTDENGNKVEASKGGIGYDDFVISIYAVTQEQADRLLSLIGSVDTTLAFDYSITNIISEEAAVYFAGGTTEDTVAKNVQSRVSLYVNEQK